MFDMTIEIREIIFGSPEYQKEITLRAKILREPLGIKFDPQELAKEGQHIHLGAFDGDRLLGCLYLSRETSTIAKMRQVAVDSGLQGKGIGGKLVRRFEEIAVAQGFHEIQLLAREAAVQFYLGLGYHTVGEPTIAVGIPHMYMAKKL